MINIKGKTFYMSVIVLVLSIISFLIIKSFIIPLIFTGILVYLFHPMHKKLLKVFRSHILTSFISILLILLLIIVPLILTATQISKEFALLEDVQLKTSLDDASNFINIRYNTNIDLSQNYDKFLLKTNDYISNLLFSRVPGFIFNVFVIIFFFYYFLKNYEKESIYFSVIFKKIKILNITYKIKNLIYGIIFGQIAVRFIQALLGAILFFFAGVSGAFFWGFLMFFAAFIPIFGTGLIWGPLLLTNIMLKNYNISLYILIIGIIVSLIDNFLLAYLISGSTKIGPIITLISILGGIELFGIYGIILGPFFVGLLFVFTEELMLRYKEETPLKKRYIWTSSEREKHSSLNTIEAKEEYEKMLNKKYEKEELRGRIDISFRFSSQNDEI